MIESAIIYLIAILVSTLALHFASKNYNNTGFILGCFIAVVVPVLIAGVRYSIGTDYFSYIRGFDLIAQGYNVRWSSFEYGYVFLNKILISFSLGSQSIMVASSLLMMSFLLKALLRKRRVMSLGLGLLIFMLIFFQSSLNVMRLMIAVCIFLYNISNIEDKKLSKFLIVTFFAASFHISALVTIPLYWVFNFLKIEKSAIRRLFVYIAIGVAVIYFNTIINWILSNFSNSDISYYENYIGSSNESSRLVVIKTIIWVPLLAPGILLYSKCKEHDGNFVVYYSLLVMGVIINSLSTFNLTYIDRLAYYFLIFAVFVIPIYMRVVNNTNRITLTLIKISVIIYVFVYWIYIYFILNQHGTVPYQWIF